MVPVDPRTRANDDIIPENILKGAENEMEKRFSELIEVIRTTDCDLLGLREKLFKYNTKYFETFKDDVLTRMEVEYKIDVQSVN